MKLIFLLAILLFSSLGFSDKKKTTADNNSPAAPEAATSATMEGKNPNYIKNFLISLGPVGSNNLVGPNGTKFGVMFAYTAGLSENFNILYFYDSNFNSASLGGTSTSDFGAGAKYFFADRLSDTSLWLSLDVNYGGGNRANDSTVGAGAAIGFDFLRTQPSTFVIYLRELVFNTSNGSTLTNLPSLTQIMVGINF